MSRGTKNTPIRIPEQIKAPAKARAAAEGRTLTDVILEHLAQYGSTPEPQNAPQPQP